MSKKVEQAEKPKKTIEQVSLLDAIAKSVGTESAMMASSKKLTDRPRLPMGCFQFDWATGGGLPFWGVTSFTGPWSGGKTTAAASCVASALKTCFRCLNDYRMCECEEGPDLKYAFWDELEGDLDLPWLETLGVDLSRLVVAYPESGAEALTAANLSVSHPDCGIVVIDSLSNLLTEQDLADNALLTSDMGQQAKLISRFVRIMRMRLTSQRRLNRPTLVIMINQVRAKPGVTFGDPETESGGNAHQHSYALKVRFEQFAIPKEQQADYLIDKEVMASRHLFKVKKFKVPVLSYAGEFIRARADLPGIGLRSGETRSINTVIKKGRDLDVIARTSKGYEIPGVKDIRTLDDLKTLMAAKPEYYRKLQAEIISARKGALKGDNRM